MVNASERRVIGGPANESDGVAWIRGFKEGETQLRILGPASTWWKFPEHYSASLGYFACNSPSGDPDPEECIGCADPSERVQNRSWKYAFNAIDKDGRVRVFKLGGKIRKTLKQREQTLGKDVLQRRDIVIIRTGTGFGGENGTEYSYEWGEEYDLEDAWPDESQMNDIGEAVTESYWEAVRKLEEGENGDVEPDDAADHEGADPDPEPEQKPPAKKTAPAKKSAPAKKAAPPAKKAAPPQKAATRGRIGASKPAEPEAEVADVTPAEPGPDGEVGDQVDPAEAVEAQLARLKEEFETDDVRKMLQENGVECPDRAPRPRVMALAEQALIDGVLPPF